MSLSEKIATLLGADALGEALEQARAHLKSNPSDQSVRHLYIDLLVLAGDYERADSQCSLAATLSPDATMGFALLRHALRGMAARDAWFESGAVPSFPGEPTALDQAAMRLGVSHRGNAADDTRLALEALEEIRGEQPLIWNGQPVGDFRDLDDRIPHALEVIMTGGGYLWIDYSRIASVTVEPIARPRDLAFRRAELCLIDDAVASVLLPAVYPGTGAQPSLRLARETTWVDEPTGITTGRGQRCFLAGDDLVSFHDMTRLEAEPLGVERSRIAHG